MTENIINEYFISISIVLRENAIVLRGNALGISENEIKF